MPGAGALRARGAEALRTRNETRGLVLAEDTHLAATFWTRAVGLLGRSSLPAGSALLIIPCTSIHTWFMKFPIDVAFLDKQGIVVAAWADVPPYRLRGARGGRARDAAPGPGGRARMALELPAGMLARSGTKRGDQIRFFRGDFRVEVS